MAIATYTETETCTIREKRKRMDMLAVLWRSLALRYVGEEPETNRLLSESQPESPSDRVESTPVVKTERLETRQIEC
jgi:hypothetical protein